MANANVKQENESASNTDVLDSGRSWWGNIRFVHVPERCGLTPRMTVAYLRRAETNDVTFAYTLVSDKDRYVKSIGRKVSADRLRLLLLGGNDALDYPVTICMSDIFSDLNEHRMNNVFSDITMSKFNIMDFKHSFISNLIVKHITRRYVDAPKYRISELF